LYAKQQELIALKLDTIQKMMPLNQRTAEYKKLERKLQAIDAKFEEITNLLLKVTSNTTTALEKQTNEQVSEIERALNEVAPNANDEEVQKYLDNLMKKTGTQRKNRSRNQRSRSRNQRSRNQRNSRRSQ
jgi:hypothetical protein